jgi:hypothetical protein
MVQKSKQSNSQDSSRTDERSNESTSAEQNASNETSTWTKTQHHISSNLLPLTQQEELYSFLLEDDATKPTGKEELVETCQQLFRYIEYLAELQERLKREKRSGDGKSITVTSCVLILHLSTLYQLKPHHM